MFLFNALTEHRLWLNKKYWYPHCYDVTLNIEFWYVMKNIASLNKMIGTVYDICRSVKSHHKETLNEILLTAQLKMTKKCYTILPIKKESARRYDRIALGNYKELIEICDWSLRVVKEQS